MRKGTTTERVPGFFELKPGTEVILNLDAGRGPRVVERRRVVRVLRAHRDDAGMTWTELETAPTS